MIRFFSKDIKFDLKSKRVIKDWIKSVIHSKNYKVGDINIIFCNDPYILEINNQFLNHNYYTDIITFNYCSDNIINGELYISVDTVKANSVEYLQNFDTELFRVIIHGILHLIGYDDINESDIKAMRDAENRALEELTLLN